MARRTGLLATLSLGAALLAISTPAFAVTVPVTLTGLGGTRQFAVEDLQGNPLAALNLGTGGAQPFRTHVLDTAFTTTSQTFDVTATMNNLYLQQGAGHNFAIKVPSSAIAINFGSNPLSATGISVTDLPRLTEAGAFVSCLNLSNTLKTALGLSALGVPTDVNNLNLAALCTLLGVNGGAVSAAANGALQTVTPVLTSLTDLPTPLSGAAGGTFSSPSFASGTVGANDPAATATPATSVALMHGGALNPTAALSTAITNALTAALSGLPLVTSNDVGAKTTLAAAVAALQGSADALTSTLGAVVAGLAPADQLTVLNTLTGTLLPPAVTDIASLNGNYYAFPILKATPSTPVAGTYDGTLTVTFVQT